MTGTTGYQAEKGDDTLSGGLGTDTLNGGLGSDTYLVDDVSDVIVERAATGRADRVIATVDFTLAAGVAVEILQTASDSGQQAQNLTGNGLAQRIIGNEGTNILSDGGSGAADTLMGLAGDDTYLIHNSGTVIGETAGQGHDQVAAGVSFDRPGNDNIEIMTTIQPDQRQTIDLTGNGLSQLIIGNAGINVLSGLAGNDTLDGGGGKDILIGGDGADT